MDRREFLKLSTVVAVAPGVTACAGPDIYQDESVAMSPYDKDSTAEEVTIGMDLSGKVAVVTGCNSGIGLETMRVLALRGVYVIGAGRTLEKAQAACASVQGLTMPVALELSSFDSVVACAESIRALNVPVDMLICNAGVRGVELEVVNGVERDMAINHLGHFLLVNRLLDKLYAAEQGRVVVVSSRAAYGSAPSEGIQFDNLDGRKSFDTSTSYAHSKLANALFSRELAKRMSATRITSNALHPGLIKTNIARDSSALLNIGFSVYAGFSGKNEAEGAATTCYVATDPALATVSGRFFEDCNAVRVGGHHHLEDDAQAARLWDVSEELTKSHRVEFKRPDASLANATEA